MSWPIDFGFKKSKAPPGSPVTGWSSPLSKDKKIKKREFVFKCLVFDLLRHLYNDHVVHFLIQNTGTFGRKLKGSEPSSP